MPTALATDEDSLLPGSDLLIPDVILCCCKLQSHGNRFPHLSEVDASGYRASPLQYTHASSMP